VQRRAELNEAAKAQHILNLLAMPNERYTLESATVEVNKYQQRWFVEEHEVIE
jgi:hypothetical protein